MSSKKAPWVLSSEIIYPIFLIIVHFTQKNPERHSSSTIIHVTGNHWLVPHSEVKDTPGHTQQQNCLPLPLLILVSDNQPSIVPSSPPESARGERIRPDFLFLYLGKIKQQETSSAVELEAIWLMVQAETKKSNDYSVSLFVSNVKTDLPSLMGTFFYGKEKLVDGWSPLMTCFLSFQGAGYVARSYLPGGSPTTYAQTFFFLHDTIYPKCWGLGPCQIFGPSGKKDHSNHVRVFYNL